MDLEHGRQVTANGKLALKKCEDLYTAIIDKIRKKRMFEKRSEEEKTKLEAEKEERLKAIDPKAALKGLVNEAVRQAVGVVKMEEDSEMGFNPAQASDHDHAGDIFAVLQPKNGLSPGGALGSNERQKGNGKGNKNKNKNNGKGKGKWKVQKQGEATPSQGTSKDKDKENPGRQWKIWKPAQKGHFNEKQAAVPNHWQRGWQNRWPQWTWSRQNQWASREGQTGGKGKSSGW